MLRWIAIVNLDNKDNNGIGLVKNGDFYGRVLQRWIMDYSSLRRSTMTMHLGRSRE